MAKKKITKKDEKINYLLDQLLMHIQVYDRVVTEMVIAVHKLKEELLKR
jgi:hypothetical protein